MQNTAHHWSKQGIFCYCLLLFCISRILLLLIAFDVNDSYHFHIPASDFFVRLDSLWYLDIVAHGYDHHPEAVFPYHDNYVFFPLLPILIKIFVLLSGLPAWITGLMISNTLFILALYLFYCLLAETVDHAVARLGVLLLCFNPYAVYFTSVYTESLFLVLSLAFWLAARHRSWFLMGIFGFLLSLTHPNGIMIFIFALWFVFEDNRQFHTSFWQYWPILLIPLGISGYMIYLYFHMGDPLGFVHNQAYWSGRTGWPVHGFINDLKTRLYGEQYNLDMFILGLVLSVFLLYNRFYKEALVMPLLVAPAVLSGSFVSLARFSATLFTFYLALSLIIYKLDLHRSALFYIFFLVLMELASIIFMVYWLQDAYLVF